MIPSHPRYCTYVTYCQSAQKMPLSRQFPPLPLRADDELPPLGPTVQNPRGGFWTVAQPRPLHSNTAHPRRSTMFQNPHTIPKIRLVLEHTIANRAVFYCVCRDAPGPKSATSGIKNRVHAHGPQCRRPDFIDIEPPANVPYINGLTEHSLSNPRKEKVLP